MTQYILQRLLQIVLIALLTSVVIFSLLHLAPGDPIAVLTGPGMDEQAKAALAAKYGLDQPLPLQYIHWLGLVLQGDLGKSFLTNQPVAELILERFINTLKLTVLAMILNVVLGVTTGVIAAVRRGSIFDVASMSVAIISFSIPPFWLAIILILVFSVWLNWLPAGGAGTYRHLILPVLALGTATAALTARMTRSAMLEILTKTYINTARAKGLRERVVLLIHAFKNALIPIITTVGLVMGLMLAGSVITETIFTYPGMGFTLIKSLSERDFPVIQGALLVTSFTYLFVNLLVDIAYVYADPRIRYS